MGLSVVECDKKCSSKINDYFVGNMYLYFDVASCCKQTCATYGRRIPTCYAIANVLGLFYGSV